MTKLVKIGLIQMSCSPNPAENMEKAVARIHEAADQGGQIICLQELFSTIYFCHEENHAYFDWAEPIPGETTRQLQTLAAERKIVLIASLFEKRAAGLYHNTAAVINADGRYLGKYRKMHIPDDPGFYEKFYFTPGDLGYPVFDTAYGKIGVLICWDQWFPEAARLSALRGAELLFYPTAIGWALDQKESVNQEEYQAWQTIQRSHAVANGIPVVSVNRVGVENDTRFWGGSFVANPFGTVLYQASSDQEEVHIQELDIDRAEHYRRIWPFLRDRRIDSYQNLTERFLDS